MPPIPARYRVIKMKHGPNSLRLSDNFGTGGPPKSSTLHHCFPNLGWANIVKLGDLQACTSAIELSSRDVMPLDGANIPVSTAFNCIETAIGQS